MASKRALFQVASVCTMFTILALLAVSEAATAPAASPNVHSPASSPTTHSTSAAANSFPYMLFLALVASVAFLLPASLSFFH